MGLIVVPALIPDITSAYNAYFEAFKDDVILEVLFPGGITEDFREGHTAHTLGYWHQSDCQYTLKCIDSVTKEVVGMALWDVYLSERPEDEWKNPGVTWLEGAHRKRAEDILNPLWEQKAKLWGGRRHVYCHVVAVKPSHQKRGAGALLMKWGLDIAEAAGLPVYLESSRAALRLYQKLGFVQVGSVTHKAELVGEESDVEVPLMVKMPSAAGGKSFDEWRGEGYPELC